MKTVYQNRRLKLAKLMGKGACLICNPPTKQRSADTDYSYRARSHFLSLANFPQDNAAFLLIAGDRPKCYLFAAPNSEHRALWEGALPSFEEIKKTHQVDEVYDINKIDEILPTLIESETTLWIDLSEDSRAMKFAQSIYQSRKLGTRRGLKPIKGIQDIGAHISEVRLFKDEEELALMRRAAEITKDAHIEAMRACQPGLTEYQIEALISFIFRKEGGSCPAYHSIVGGGANACVLHYTENEDTLKNGDLLLIDAGVEYQNYAADVTRTFPVNGTFTDAQKEIYEIVLNSQLKGIEMSRVGNTFSDVHEASALALAEGLIDLGLLKGKPQELITAKEFTRYYPHRTSHWLGMDVHDVGQYVIDGRSRQLEPGMVLTIEPGLYFPSKFEEIPEKYRGIGIRIEDDILVTAGEPEILTEGIPKTVREIESTMKETSFYPHTGKTLSAS